MDYLWQIMIEILDLAFDLFVFWLLYKLIFGFIIPIYRAAKHIKSKVNEAHSRMQGNSQPPPVQNPPRSNTAATPQKEGEYIDFEEVKWKFFDEGIQITKIIFYASKLL